MGYWNIGTLEYWDLNLDSIIPSFRYSKPCYFAARRLRTTRHMSIFQQPAAKDAVDSRIPEVVIGIDVVQASRKYCKEEL